MSLLDTIQKPEDRPLMATILGDAGMGKTRLAAAFPKPIFIRAEDGLQSVPVDDRPDAFPQITSPGELWEQLTALIREKHDYATLVVDSVTALERLFIESVMEKDGRAKAIAQAMGGYGAGYQAVGAQHQRVRKAAGILNTKRGMNVIFIAHAEVETMRSPDLDDFMRYTLRLNQKYSLAPYVDDVDLVGFVRLQSFIKGDDGERKRVFSTGRRELVVHANASNVSKNRFGLEEPMPFNEGENPLADLIPSINQGKRGRGRPKKSEQRQNAPEPSQEPDAGEDALDDDAATSLDEVNEPGDERGQADPYEND